MKKNKIYDIGKVLALVAFGFAVKSVLGSSEYNQCIDPVTGLLIGGGIASSLLGRKKSKAAPPPKPVDIFAKKPIYGKGKNKKNRSFKMS
jgi:hypothetical protein